MLYRRLKIINSQKFKCHSSIIEAKIRREMEQHNTCRIQNKSQREPMYKSIKGKNENCTFTNYKQKEHTRQCDGHFATFNSVSVWMCQCRLTHTTWWQQRPLPAKLLPPHAGPVGAVNGAFESRQLSRVARAERTSGWSPAVFFFLHLHLALPAFHFKVTFYGIFVRLLRCEFRLTTFNWGENFIYMFG